MVALQKNEEMSEEMRNDATFVNNEAIISKSQGHTNITDENYVLLQSNVENIVQQLLDTKKVFTKNIKTLSEVILRFYLDGIYKLQIVTDFDHTISSYQSKCGKESFTTYKVLFTYKDDCFNLRSKEEQLTKKYSHLEFNHKLSNQDKIPFMISWWKEANELLIDSGMTKEDVITSGKESQIFIREGFLDVLRKCQNYCIPILIGSAGIGDVISSRLDLDIKDKTGIELISNFFEYKNNIICGFSGPMIHSYNKSLISSLGSSYFSKNKNRTNLIIFGDSVGDVDMVKEIPWHIDLLRIGFHNFKKNDLMEQYLETYDIVVSDPSSMIDLTPLLEFLLH